MIRYRLAHSEDDFRQMLLLQRKNVKSVLSQNEIKKEGFVTIEHSLEDLERMNKVHKHALAIENQNVVGFALVTAHDYGNAIPFLAGKFNLIDSLKTPYGELNASTYFLMGQICIEKSFRGRGVFKALYNSLKDQLSEIYSYCVTIISEENKRSLRAHEKVGFIPMHKYEENDSNWVIVLWDWN